MLYGISLQSSKSFLIPHRGDNLNNYRQNKEWYSLYAGKLIRRIKVHCYKYMKRYTTETIYKLYLFDTLGEFCVIFIDKR